MIDTTIIDETASFSEKLNMQIGSSVWEVAPIQTLAPDLKDIEDISDIRAAIEAQTLYREQGQNAFVSFDDLKASRD